ncbi:hypothetical protein COLO4_23846 [Corchorus olitorius]|uniref:Clp R domain-containing protein n=1 Tax=Corchorus olitorius TaxID=93759 RepID=A0A1R3IEF4_9ROSI|nr:hypothetical protein COLO4_23846 [Corchorus olitorius]
MAAAPTLSNPATTTQVIAQSIIKSKPSSSSSFPKPYSLESPWLGIKLSVQSSNPKTRFPNHRQITATVSFSLPTAKPDRVTSTEKVPKWSRRAIKSFAMAELEARKLRHATTGNDALLMGILIEGTSLASKFLRANGITLFKVREETAKVVGKGDRFFYSPEHPPLTEAAQTALDWAVDQKLKSGDDGEITTTHLLLGIWSEVESPGHKILETLGFNDEKAKELISLSSEPGSVDG